MNGFSKNNNITVKEIINALNQLQTQLEKKFSNYTRCLYSSKVKSYFPNMLAPTFQGVWYINI